MIERFLPLHNRVRVIVMLLAALIVLGLVNIQIVGREAVVLQGTTMLLRLAPRDPRSLLQGDYMALRYAMTRELGDAAAAAEVSDGYVIVELDEKGEASFVALHASQQLTANQHLLRFRKRGESVRLASDAYFFEEGQWETYSNARFGELRVAEDGDAVLTGLRDENGLRLGQPVRR